MIPLGQEIDEALAEVPPLPYEWLPIGGRFVPVDPASGPIRIGEMIYFNADTGMVYQRRPL